MDAARAAVRLWHATGGSLPTLGPFLLRTAGEASASAATFCLAAQAASMAMAAASDPVASSWPQLALVGGVGAAVAAAMLDSGCAQPLLFQQARDQHPSIS